jgi:hypothetical protein
MAKEASQKMEEMKKNEKAWEATSFGFQFALVSVHPSALVPRIGRYSIIVGPEAGVMHLALSLQHYHQCQRQLRHR